MASMMSRRRATLDVLAAGVHESGSGGGDAVKHDHIHTRLTAMYSMRAIRLAMALLPRWS